MADVTAAAERVGDVDFFGFRAPDGLDGGALRELALSTRGRAGQGTPAVVLVLAVEGDKVAAVATVNDAAQQAGVAAREVLGAALPAIEGRGGGKADVAQGGGSRVEGIDEAVAAARALLAARR
jgi:alanyl-tRNA synthetase